MKCDEHVEAELQRGKNRGLVLNVHEVGVDEGRALERHGITGVAMGDER